MNWQFYMTALLFTVILIITAFALIMITLAGGNENAGVIGLVIAAITVLFWIVVGIMSAMSLIWNWGLVC